jgi:hypothetical protein
MLRMALRTASLSALAVLLGLVLLPADAFAVSVSQAQLKGGQLRVDGGSAAPGIVVTVESAASGASARSDQSGAFHVTATNFRSDDCKVVVSDRQTFTATVPLTGCTPTPATPPSTAPAPSGGCVIDRQSTPPSPAAFKVGDVQTLFFTTSGCTGGPLQWKLLGGHIPTGMTGPFFQGQTAGAVSGRPTVEGTYSFMMQATDGTGATDAETFTITVAAPRPLYVSTASAAPGTVGRSYRVNMAADGGLPGYQWTLRSGALPSGLRLTSAGAVAGTPTTPGTSSFTVHATDSRGLTADRTLSITVN